MEGRKDRESGMERGGRRSRQVQGKEETIRQRQKTRKSLNSVTEDKSEEATEKGGRDKWPYEDVCLY